jgi:hypothetical protein
MLHSATNPEKNEFCAPLAAMMFPQFFCRVFFLSRADFTRSSQFVGFRSRIILGQLFQLFFVVHDNF